MFTLLDLCVSSLRRGHANLLCIIPILSDDLRGESNKWRFAIIKRRTVKPGIRGKGLQGKPAWSAHPGGIEPADRPTQDRKVAGSRPGCGTPGVEGHGLEGPSCDRYQMQAMSCEQQVSGGQKNLVTLLDLCVSSLRRGHANLLCIVPILSDDLRGEPNYFSFAAIKQQEHTEFPGSTRLSPHKAGQPNGRGTRLRTRRSQVQAPLQSSSLFHFQNVY